MSYLPLWKKAPFLRLTIPFTGGIAIQRYADLPFVLLSVLSFASFITLILLYKSSFICFRYYWIRGILLNLLLICTGSILLVCRDGKFHANSLDHSYCSGDYVVAKLEEPPITKSNTCQARATVEYLITENIRKQVQGIILLYFNKKDLSASIIPIQYGDRIIFRKSLLPITYTGNPGAFDYQHYCLLQQIRFTVLLGKKDWIKLPWPSAGIFQLALIHIREKILGSIRSYLSGSQEIALAEALLIGYRNDLDRDLSQAYSNTGVVHIIAISGLHLALIYELLAFCLHPLRSGKTGKWMRIIIIIFALWGFSFLTGASPSVLRSAMMFTCIAMGEVISKKNSVYNNFSASAFLLLCYNPYWLWDIGFQLSYTAVLSIVIFMKPIYKLFSFRNRIGDWIWKSVAVTMAAQVLTVPICIYQFHQFPTYFLPANLIAVPLSSLILIGELLVCCTTFIPIVARMTGYVLSRLIWLLNHFISFTAQLPFSTWNGLEISTAQCWLIYGIIAGMAAFYFFREIRYFIMALLALTGLVTLRSISFFSAGDQQIMIVYNVPHHQVIDCIDGRYYYAKEDSSTTSNKYLQNSCCRPARIRYRAKKAGSLPEIKGIGCFFTWEYKRMLLLNMCLQQKK